MPKLLAWVLIVSLGPALWAGCASEDPPAPISSSSSPQADSVQAYLDAIDRDALVDAFARLSNTAFTRTIRTEQLEDEQVVAWTERTVHYARGTAGTHRDVVEVDSSGSVRGGWVGQLAARHLSSTAPAALGAHILPEDPPYRSRRNEHLYTYQFAADTVVDAHRLHVFDIRSHEDAENAPDIRRVRLYVDPDTRALRGMYLEQRTSTLLYEEVTRLRTMLAPASDTGWTPSTFRVDSYLDLPLQRARHVRTTSTFTYPVSTSAAGNS